MLTLKSEYFNSYYQNRVIRFWSTQNETKYVTVQFIRICSKGGIALVTLFHPFLEKKNSPTCKQRPTKLPFFHRWPLFRAWLVLLNHCRFLNLWPLFTGWPLTGGSLEHRFDCTLYDRFNCNARSGHKTVCSSSPPLCCCESKFWGCYIMN